MGKVEKFIEPQPIRNGSLPIYYQVDMNGCFNCKSHRLDRDGYARLDRYGKEWQMHRYVYTITYNVVLEPGMVVRHKCDNPSCINPKHLALGTQLENMRDKMLRNRPIKRSHKLTIHEQREINESELTIPQLALKYDVSHSTIVKAKAKNRIKNERKRAGDKPVIKKDITRTKRTKKASTE